MPTHRPAVRPIFLPGLAADAALFAPQVEAFPGSVTPAWIAPAHARESLIDYAKRFAAHLVQAHHLADAARHPAGFALVGFSFGGQIAMEAARTMDPPPRAVVLVCGVRGREAFTPQFFRQQRLGSIAPRWLMRAALAPAARAFAARAGLDARWTRELIAMARRNDVAFLKWSARACAGWRVDGSSPEPELAARGITLRHIHGQRDDIIPDPSRRADVTIRGAHHLITWTHAQAVNDFIAASISPD